MPVLFTSSTGTALYALQHTQLQTKAQQKLKASHVPRKSPCSCVRASGCLNHGTSWCCFPAVLQCEPFLSLTSLALSYFGESTWMWIPAKYWNMKNEKVVLPAPFWSPQSYHACLVVTLAYWKLNLAVLLQTKLPIDWYVFELKNLLDMQSSSSEQRNLVILLLVFPSKNALRQSSISVNGRLKMFNQKKSIFAQ